MNLRNVVRGTTIALWTIVAVVIYSSNAHAQVNDNCSNNTECVNANNTNSGRSIVANCDNLSTCLTTTNTGHGSGVTTTCNSESGFACVYADNSANDGEGIHAISNAGVGALGASTFGTGVEGYSTNSNGVTGITASSGASGVIGVNGVGGIGTAGRISPAGVGIAIYADNTSSSGWAGYFNGNVNVAGTLTATTYGPSDARLKKDVKDTRYGLNDVLKLRPVSFKWIKGDDSGPQQGLIAQEVQKIIPDLVHQDTAHHPDGPDGMLSVNYVGLVPVLAKAIQEQQKIIEQQSARLSALERDHAPKTASLLGSNGGMGLALGLLPLGLVVAARRRKQRGG